MAIVKAKAKQIIARRIDFMVSSFEITAPLFLGIQKHYWFLTNKPLLKVLKASKGEQETPLEALYWHPLKTPLHSILQEVKA
jgi:hypothetical protein